MTPSRETHAALIAELRDWADHIQEQFDNKKFARALAGGWYPDNDCEAITTRIAEMDGHVERARRAADALEAADAERARLEHRQREIILYAVRYALGRRSYAVGQVCDEVMALLPAMSEADREVMARDIDEALSEAAAHGYTLGDPCDDEAWRRLRAALKGAQP